MYLPVHPNTISMLYPLVLRTWEYRCHSRGYSLSRQPPLLWWLPFLFSGLSWSETNCKLDISCNRDYICGSRLVVLNNHQVFLTAQKFSNTWIINIKFAFPLSPAAQMPAFNIVSNYPPFKSSKNRHPFLWNQLSVTNSSTSYNRCLLPVRRNTHNMDSIDWDNMKEKSNKGKNHIKYAI